MAVLLETLLSDPESFSNICRDLDNPSPPVGLDAEAWQYKEELPLHLINYLREATSEILSSSIAKQTPSKLKRTSKYDYNSPVKSVAKEKPKKPRKEKKKVKLFSASKHNTDNLSNDGEMEGIGELPNTPLRQQKPKTPRDDRDYKKSSKQTPSPQTLSLADFIKPDSNKMSTSRSPKKSKTRVKSSTPKPESFQSRLGRVEEGVGKLDLTDKDSFPGIGEGETKKRRIKPISLSEQSESQAGFGRITQRPGLSSHFSVEEVDKDSVDDRKLMMEAAALTPFKGTTARPQVTPNKIVTKAVIPADATNVTFKLKLDLLASLYSYVLLNNLMPNLTVEIYFLGELLQAELYEPREIDPEGLFSSLHNCVYFSVKVLEEITQYFQYFDRSTLKLLIENSRIKTFSQNLSTRFQELSNGISEVSPPKNKSSGLQNVSFQTETDNRVNFPSNSSFHDFKKQRDKFYTLIRNWSDHQRGKDYDFSVVFGKQVEDVLNMHKHSVNYSHFASLFLLQLLAMCREDNANFGRADLSVTGQGLLGKDDLSSLKSLDPLKYARLAARLVTPSQLGGPCPPPVFSGSQEFFRDFILHCNSPRLLAYLKNAIVSEIWKHDGKYFGGEDQSLLGKSDPSILSETSLTEEGSLVTSDNNHEVQQTLLTLRLLGKFLGFVEFFPFTFTEHNDKEFVKSDDPVILLRKESTSPLDIKHALERAETEGRLILTLPWILEYLSQMDPLAHHVEVYKTISFHLVKIYQNVLRSNSQLTSGSVAFFLSAYMGWVLEKDEFPRDLIILARFEDFHSKIESELSIDRSFIVPQSLLYQCCPWLSEIKVILTTSTQSGNLPSLEKDSYRKITPISAPKPSQRDQTANLQKEMEENFLRNQPSSLRRTVEFLAERFASNIIKTIRNQLVPSQRAVIFKIIHENFTKLSTKDLENYSRTTLTELESEITSTLFHKLENDALAALYLLVSEDVHPAAKDRCVGMTVRCTKEKVNQWTAQNLTIHFFINEFTGERDRMIRLAEKGTNRETETLDLTVSHDPEAPNPSGLMIKMKKDIVELLLPSEKSHATKKDSAEDKEEKISSLLESLENCILHRKDLTPVAVQGIGSVSVDWILSLISSKPDLVTPGILSALLRIWKLISPSQLLSILSPVSLALLDQSRDPDKSWSKMCLLLRRLLEEKLLPSLALEDSCLELLQQDWPDSLLNRLGACLEDIQKQGSFDGAMDWILWFTSRNDSDD